MKSRELRKHAEELQLPFVPQEQVRWLAPHELARTAGKVVLALTLAGYLDKREIQGALDSEPLQAPLGDPGAQEIWIDYAADLGDGFDATGTVAWTMAAQEADVERPGSAPARLPRGSLLVLGGDEVYPVASATAYENRMKGPFRAALPTAEDRPLMVALPGNHDWYDGLTAFLRIFAQRRDIGGWRTRQTRSYFVVRLPGRWWLVGLDSQLGAYIDDPQLRYFETHLSSRLGPGDGVIVCSATPAWVESAQEDADAFNSLHWFDRNIVRTRVTDRETGAREPTGAAVRLWLTGDKHHYARYAERLPTDPPGPGALPPDPRRRQLVTCGLGGAYLTSTHGLPAALPLPPRESHLREKDSPPVGFALAQHTCPAAEESRRIARRIAFPWSRGWPPRRNPGFGALAAGVHAVLFLIVSFVFALARGTIRPDDAVRTAGWEDALRFAAVLVAVVAALIALPWLARLVRKRRHETASLARSAAPPGPAVAALLQGVVALGVLVAAVALPFPSSWPGWTVLLLCLLLAGAAGATAGSEAFALWVLRARHGTVAEWQMSGQSIEDHKGFLRLHIAPDGDLTLHALMLDGICRDWHLEDDPAGGKRPVPDRLPPVRPIEDPVVIAREAKPP
ncbi:hypothetical protein FGW37_32510 [Streptomyces rectiverticillatus]|uniref:hypothetical protein n=1 Tax=Streptomyces rectiverticillatus TaxID=173860 RepID=UPI0015C38E47|nr:hypothetical protein [Streptomyces rectiverticillatus]QLE75688.1 hypothetical protein FGW37_32510 [Streptomyces rectiverticillatus]